MTDTVVSTPDPEEGRQHLTFEQFQAELDKAMPGAKLLSNDFAGIPGGTIDVSEYLRPILEGRIGPGGKRHEQHWGYDVYVPPQGVAIDPPGYEGWKRRVKSKLRHRKDRIEAFPDLLKALPSQLREYVRFRVHDYLIGWVLDVNVDPRFKFPIDHVKDKNEDVFLHL